MSTNTHTIVDPRWRRAGTRDAPTARLAFERVYPRLREAALERSAGDRMFVAAVHTDGTVHDVIVPAGSFLVIGRHTRCPLRLEHEAVSLRHLVARFTDDPVKPTIRLWDLRTGQSFFAEDDQESGSVIAENVLFVALGHYRLLFVPLRYARDFERAENAWGALPERRFAHARVPSERGGVHHPSRATVTHTLPPMVFGAAMTRTGPPFGHIALELPDGTTERVVSREQLERGLLFGRYDRCELGLGEGDRLSRVHLFLVQIDDEVWAVDTASTNGTFRNGSPVGQVSLGLQATLLLAGESLIRWQRGVVLGAT